MPLAYPSLRRWPVAFQLWRVFTLVPANMFGMAKQDYFFLILVILLRLLALFKGSLQMLPCAARWDLRLPGTFKQIAVGIGMRQKLEISSKRPLVTASKK